MAEMVVVLGATGYVGQILVPALLATGRRVTMIARRRPPILPTGAAFAACDVTDLDALTKSIIGADMIVNAVAGSPATILHTATNLVTVLTRNPGRRLVHMSSLAVFGQRDGMLGEATIPLPPALHAYGVAKWRAEAALLSASALRSQCFILRPGCIYGVGAPVWSDRIGRLLLARRLGWLGPEARGWCAIVHVVDVVRAVLAALDAVDGAAGVHHVLAAESLTWNGFFVRFGLHLGLSDLPSIGPARLGAEAWLVAPFDRLRSRFSHRGIDVITPTMRRLFRQRALAIQMRPRLLARSSLRSLDEGLVEVAASLLHRQASAARQQHSLTPTWVSVS